MPLTLDPVTPGTVTATSASAAGNTLTVSEVVSVTLGLPDGEGMFTLENDAGRLLLESGDLLLNESGRPPILFLTPR